MMSDHIALIDRAKELIARGNKIEARDFLIRICHDFPSDISLQLGAAVISFNEQWLSADTLEIIGRCLEANSELSDLWFMYAHTCFALGNENLDENQGIDAAVQSLTLNPENLQTYHTLVLSYLLQRRYLEAYMAGCAMAKKAGENDKIAKSLMGFSQLLMDPTHIPFVGFIVDNEQLAYTINVMTPQSITASMSHYGGHVDELEELRFARGFVSEADKILELGTHSGNHTAFFLNFLLPSRYVGLEEHPKHAEITRQVAFLNTSVGTPCDVDVQNIRVGSACDSIRIHGQDVSCRPLDQIVDGPWNFIRFDLGGTEMDVFKGAEDILCNGNPKLMICIRGGDGTSVIEWLKSRGYSLVNTISDGAKHTHFLDRTPR